MKLAIDSIAKELIVESCSLPYILSSSNYPTALGVVREIFLLAQVMHVL